MFFFMLYTNNLNFLYAFTELKLVPAEEKPPKGEDPVIWILITDLPIGTLEDVSKIIEYYLCRWQIELFFFLLLNFLLHTLRA